MRRSIASAPITNGKMADSIDSGDGNGFRFYASLKKEKPRELRGAFLAARESGYGRIN